jgi:hypothetical protein
MGGECSTCEEEDSYILWLLCGNVKERVNLKDISVDGM